MGSFSEACQCLHLHTHHVHTHTHTFLPRSAPSLKLARRRWMSASGSWRVAVRKDGQAGGDWQALESGGEYWEFTHNETCQFECLKAKQWLKSQAAISSQGKHFGGNLSPLTPGSLQTTPTPEQLLCGCVNVSAVSRMIQPHQTTPWTERGPVTQDCSLRTLNIHVSKKVCTLSNSDESISYVSIALGSPKMHNTTLISFKNLRVFPH